MYGTIPTPEGTRDRLFGECQDRRRVQTALREIFSRRCFCEVSTPEVEFYDLFLRSGNPIPQEQMLKIIDRSGRIMVMRPDSTTPIARLAGAKLSGQAMPQRLFYDQTVFRSGPEHKGGRGEIAQCGVELLGAEGLRADAEIIALAVDALRACGLEGFHIEIGHVNIFRDLAATLELPEGETERIRSLIEGKNFAALSDALKAHSHQAAGRALARLPYLFGGIEVLNEAEVFCSGSATISYLRDLYRELCDAGYKEYIRFDLGLVHQIEYYSGVIFRGFALGAADSILSGGRYDQLLSSFGLDSPATGFAVDVDSVVRCLTPAERPMIQALIHYECGFLKQALELQGQATGQMELSTADSVEKSVEIGRQKGTKRLLLVGSDGVKEVEL